MKNIAKEAQELGLHFDEILLPSPETDMQKWAVVACDQYTSEPEYWQEVEEKVGDAPSTLRLIFPEVYLERENTAQKEDRITKIQGAMQHYLDCNIFCAHQSPILVERSAPNGSRRLGLVVAVDLEKYDFSKGSQSLVRATEGTILDRLPPRMVIRDHAALELPHIMVLIDDPNKTVIEPMLAKAQTAETSVLFQQIYNFDLMQNSGHLRAWKTTDPSVVHNIVQNLKVLANPEYFKGRYNATEDQGVLLFAVGDGNHSLATAKSCWDKLKGSLSEAVQVSHPSRFALVELVNVHDAGLLFEPIHRVLFHVDTAMFLDAFQAWHEERGIQTGAEQILASKMHFQEGQQEVFLVSENESFRLSWENPNHEIAVGSLQAFLDDFLQTHRKTAIDYVHGWDTTARLGKMTGNIGFLLPDVDKNSFFTTVVQDGALPRKTFSMGEAHEKRFYVEARRILPK